MRVCVRDVEQGKTKPFLLKPGDLVIDSVLKLAYDNKGSYVVFFFFFENSWHLKDVCFSPGLVYCLDYHIFGVISAGCDTVRGCAEVPWPRGTDALARFEIIDSW